ncbi:MAG: hypothetical protein EPO19_03265 [Betaproteobacteria bacterium]|nr:MAG: hypothetical protein EPO19_03265 [Betaproteobacteria bacterium]
MKLRTSLIATLLLAACASHSGSGLAPGEARREQVQALMGPPALSWKDADGSVQLAYPLGPAGFDTYMVKLGPDGRLQSIANVLDEQTFARIRAGMTKDEVLRLIGPPDYSRSAYFKARDELAWEWRFREIYGNPARFAVLFDATAGSVRNTMILPEHYPKD